MKRKSLLLGTACSTLIACGTLAYAQDAGTPTPIQGISKSADTAGGTAKTVKIPLKSTYSASVITKKMLETISPAKTAQDILAREPSIFVTDNGPGGVNQQITFRSFNSAQFAETYDGIGLNDAFNGAVTAQADNDNNTLVTSNDIDSVMLYRGINNPAVNSYNSLGGTINYLPRTPTDNAGADIGAGYGSFNTVNWHATLNTGLYDGVKQVFSFARENSNGWTQQDKNSGSNLFYGVDAPLNGGTTNVYASFIYNSSAGDVNQLQPVDVLHAAGDSYQLPSSDYYKQNTSTNYMAIFGVTQQFTPELSGDVKGFFSDNDYSRNSYCNKTFAGTYLYPISDCSHRAYHLYEYYTNTVGVQPSLTWTLPFNTVQVGSNLTFSHLHSAEFFSATSPVPQDPLASGNGNDFWNEHDYRTLGSVYLQDDISLLDDKLKITPGVKYLYAITKDTDQAAYYYPYTGSASNVDHYVSPTVGISYELLTGLDAYAAYGQNVNFPGISSFYNNIATNSGSVEPVRVQPEYVSDYEGGLRYEMGSLTAEADYYYEDFTHTFTSVTDQSTGNTTTANGGSSRYDGEEMQLGDDFGNFGNSAVPGDFAGYMNFAHNTAVFTSTFTDPTTGSVIKSGQSVGNVPDYLVSTGVNWTYGNYYVGVDTRYAGRQTIYLAGTTLPSSTAIGGYFLTDLTLQDTVPVNMGAVKALVLTLNVDNLFGVRYYTQADVNTENNIAGTPYKEGIVGAPRAIYGSVTAKF
jgi:outer membrane receptor protein involved in Fe transport